MGLGLELGLAGANVVGNQIQAAQQYNRSKKLMALQLGNQKALNEQGQQLQMKTWQETGAPAQVEMLKQAGLNPGLMYSKGGAGGTTGGQTGGSASMGNAPQMAPMNLTNILEMKQIEAQTKLLEAQKAKTEAETPQIAPTAETGRAKTGAETENIKADTAVKQIQAGIMQIQQAKTEEQITTAINKTVADTKLAVTEGYIRAGEADARIQSAKLAVVTATLENELTESKTNLTEAEKKGIITGIVQKWTELNQKQQGLSLEAQKIKIETFSKEMEAEYPGAWNVIGNVMKKAYKSLENIETYFRGEAPKDKIK